MTQPGDEAAPVLLDREVLAELQALEQPDEPGLVQGLVDGFVATGPVELAQIRDALTRNDAAQLSRTAHRFRGTATNLGAHVVAQRCLSLERLGRAGTVEGGQALADELAAEYHETVSVLRKLQEDGPWNRSSPPSTSEAPS
jgi:HPt (histidine-containing phosphotransfer) domain-containing protein